MCKRIAGRLSCRIDLSESIMHFLPQSFYQSQRRSQAGFTLVELIAVVMVIAVLIGILLGITGRIKRKSMDSLSRSQMQQMMVALESYSNDMGTYPVTPCDSPRMTYGTQSFPSPVGTRPYMYRSMLMVGGTNGTSGTGAYLGGVTIPCIVSNSAALYRAINGKYYKSKFTQSASIAIKDYDSGNSSTNTVYVDPYTTPWGYFNTKNPDWKIRQFNPVGYDLWTYGPYAFSYSFNCGTCGPTGSVTVGSAANPINAMIANWGHQ